MTTTRYHSYQWPERRLPVNSTPLDGEAAYLVSDFYLERGGRRETWRQNTVAFWYIEAMGYGETHRTTGYARPGEVVTANLLMSDEPDIDRGPRIAQLLAERRLVEIGTIRRPNIERCYVELSAAGARIVYDFERFCRSQIVEYFGHPVESPEGVEVVQPRRKSEQFPSGPTVTAKDRRGVWETYSWPRLLRSDHVGEDRTPSPENVLVAGRLYPDDRLELIPEVRAEMARRCVESIEGVGSAPYFAETIAQLAEEPEPRATEPQLAETPAEAPAEATVPKPRKRGAA
ncbi:MAG TPA: hypothetical protein VMX33_15110 [bacterium]|nr:hypothetical protein [bacterium]